MKDIREDLKAYIDGELLEARAQEVEAAIASDPALQQEVHFMRMLGFEIKKVAASTAPVQGAAETIHKIRKPGFSFGRIPVVPALATVLLVAGVSAVIFPMFAQAKDAQSEMAMSQLKRSTASSAMPAEAGFEDGGATASAPEGSGGGSMGFGESVSGNQERGDSTMGLEKPVTSGGSGDKSKFENPTTPQSQWFNDKDRKAARTGAAASRPMATIDRSIEVKGSNPGSVHQTYKQPQLIRKADMSVKVDSVHKAQDKMTDISKKLSGFIANTALNVQPNQVPEATMVFRVPVANFDAAMIEIRNMGEVIAETSNSEDVTATVADQESRIVSYAEMEKSLIAELNKTKDANLKFQIRQRLAEVRANRQSVKDQNEALRDIADYSTINLKFVGRPQGEDSRQSQGWSDDTWTNATNSSRGVGRFFGTIGMYLLAYAPFWIPFTLIALYMARKRRA